MPVVLHAAAAQHTRLPRHAAVAGSYGISLVPWRRSTQAAAAPLTKGTEGRTAMASLRRLHRMGEAGHLVPVVPGSMRPAAPAAAMPGLRWAHTAP